jgi:pSer/pThr/pTyr-binding forkhead associated (FHA) protein
MAGILLLVLRLAMAVSLYLFLGWALLVLWRDLKRHSEVLAARQAPSLTLAARLQAGAVEYQAEIQEILIGREPACDVYLEDLTVSAQHARLAFHHGQWWVEDLHSRNGTFLNQEKVLSQVVLASGDELQLGEVMVQVAIGDR